LVNLGGSATSDHLTDEYNRIHFPRNVGYKELNISETKKTLQGDTAKLLRDRLISREYRKPNKRDPYKPFRKYGFYQITEYGYYYIKQYDICKPLEIKR
jgi:CRISPR/Cas system-associated protein Cas10 (large subunit of type III CRISPR-Cas system)